MSIAGLKRYQRSKHFFSRLLKNGTETEHRIESEEPPGLTAD